MKKLITIISVLVLASTALFAQRPDYEVYDGLYVGVNDKQILVLWFEADNVDGSGSKLYYTLSGVQEVKTLHEELVYLHTKLTEYNQIAKDNNVTDFNKDLVLVSAFGRGVWFIWGNEWAIGSKIGSKAFKKETGWPTATYQLVNGKGYITIQAWYRNITNQFCEVYGQLVFDEEELEYLINYTADYDTMANDYNTNYVATANLFN